MLGLETALSVVQETMVETGLLDWAGVAERLSAAPARIGRCDTGDRAQGSEGIEAFVTHEREFTVKAYEGEVENLSAAEPRGAGWHCSTSGWSPASSRTPVRPGR